MIDNKEIVAELMHSEIPISVSVHKLGSYSLPTRAALHTNQNTHLYGLVDPRDGNWRDKDGKDLKAWDPNFKKASGSMGLAGIIETIKKM